MPSAKNREQLRSEELPEFPFTGPFGGIQSELPLTVIEDIGFSPASSNFICRLGTVQARPGFTALTTIGTAEPILGAASFYNVNGTLIQVIFTPTRLLQYAAGTWTQITGTAFGGSSINLFSWDVLNYKLVFSQGVDKPWYWDGITAGYSQTSASAPIARFLAEVGLHILAVNPSFPQRYYWSGVGDPTDWTGYTSGLNDIVNNLGPINGITKIGQYGFGFHQNGLMEIVPTGSGLYPFSFTPIINATQGCVAPYSLDHYDDQGMEFAVFLGIDNVYIFNGSSVEPIGDRPVDGRRRLGARSAILTDVLAGNVANIYGKVTYSIAGNPFRAYWLLIPNIACWVYNFDENNWMRLSWASKVDTLEMFFKQSSIRIMDLTGPISSQSWSPSTITLNSQFGGLLLGFDSGVAGYVDFTNYSELGGQVVSGKLTFGDRRHRHTVKKFRLTVKDLGPVTYTVTLTNEKNKSQSQSFTIGSGSGDELSYIADFSITGLRLQWAVSVPANSPASIIEFAPYYDTSGEQRNGSLEN